MDPNLGGLLPSRPNPEQRAKALADPGPTWRQWFFSSFLKVWIPLGFLVIDVWIVGAWVEAHFLWGSLPSLVLAFYLEFLGFQALWYRPSDASHSIRPEDRKRWVHPVAFGVWTPEGRRVRAGLPPYGSGDVRVDQGPDPAEFL